MKSKNSLDKILKMEKRVKREENGEMKRGMDGDNFTLPQYAGSADRWVI